MMRRHFDAPAALQAMGLASLMAALACAATPEPVPAPAPQARAGGRQPSADVQFLQHMIPHHAQALQMTALVTDRASRPELRLVAERIAVSQRDEIAQMSAWLRARGEAVPAADTAGMHHGAHAAPAGTPHATMPGMLTAAELSGLAAARGAEFDRLFLELMIRHHEGAITMVQALFAGGGGQESQMYALASDVESDQRMEIARMRAILGRLPSPPPPRR